MSPFTVIIRPTILVSIHSNKITENFIYKRSNQDTMRKNKTLATILGVGLGLFASCDNKGTEEITQKPEISVQGQVPRPGPYTNQEVNKDSEVKTVFGIRQPIDMRRKVKLFAYDVDEVGDVYIINTDTGDRVDPMATQPSQEEIDSHIAVYGVKGLHFEADELADGDYRAVMKDKGKTTHYKNFKIRNRRLKLPIPRDFVIREDKQAS
jgi:hypothetical protein